MLQVMLASKSREKKKYNGVSGIPILVISIVVLWVFLGMLYYHFVGGWTFYDAYFYSIQAGLSVGYGNIQIPPDNVGDQVFTTAYILLGSSIVAGSMGLAINWVTNVADSFTLNMRLARHEQTKTSVRNADGKLNYDKLKSYIWFQTKSYLGLYSTPARTIICFTWAIWMILGALFWMYTQNQNFMAGLYFAISSCSTSGLFGPPCHDPATNATNLCTIGMLQAIFVGTYILIGIPLYAAALGSIGSILVDWCYGSFVAAEEQERSASPIPLAELRYILQKIEAPDIDTLTKTEYIVMELVRLGKLSLKDIVVHMDNFTKADTSMTGYLSIDEMVACGMAVLDQKHDERELIYGLTPRNSSTNLLSEHTTSKRRPSVRPTAVAQSSELAKSNGGDGDMGSSSAPSREVAKNNGENVEKGDSSSTSNGSSDNLSYDNIFVPDSARTKNNIGENFV